MNLIPVLKCLGDIYPGIQDELCNRHSSHLIRVKHKFQQLYDAVKMQHFVIANGMCQMQGAASIAVENGVVVALSETEVQGNLYVNYDKWEEEANQAYELGENLEDELVLSYKGEVKSNVRLGDHNQRLANKLAKVYETAVEDLSLGKIKGGVIYISSTLAEGHFYEEEALVFCFYTAILKINGLAEDYTTSDILKKLRGIEAIEQDRITKYGQIFGLENNCLQVNHQLVELTQSECKFVFVKVPQSNTFKKDKQDDQIAKLMQLQTNYLKQLSNQQVEQMIKDRSIWSSIKQQYLQQQQKQQKQSGLLSQLINHIDGFAIVQNGSYLMLHAHRQQSIQIVRKVVKQLKDLMNPQGEDQHEAKDVLSEPLRKYPQFMKSKWSKSMKSSSLAFSSLPCLGIGILDPSDEIWFNE